jgi:hypothetical protein
MSAWRTRPSAGLLTGIALALAVTTASGCARADQFGDGGKAIAPERAKAVARAYHSLLSAERCARRATDQQAVAIQLDRVSQVAARAEAGGLGELLLKTQADWTHFDETADWVCGKGDPLAGLTSAVDAFDRAVVEALAER